MKHRNHWLLIEWGDWHIRHMDWTGLPSINAVERYFFEPGRAGDPGHRILAPEMPRRLQDVERAVDRLPLALKRAVTVKYCAPLRVDGVIYTHKELARVIGVTQAAFERSLLRGRNKVFEEIG